MRTTKITVIFSNDQRGITQELTKGEQSFLCGTHCLDLIYISTKYHEDILKIVYGRTDGFRHAIKIKKAKSPLK